MKITHIVPSHSAASSLREALRIKGRADEVLAFGDDLSHGPIASPVPDHRADWLMQEYDWPEIEEDIRSFWMRVDQTEGKLIIWFGRHSARELAFRYAWAWRMNDRPYSIIDVTGLKIPFLREDGSPGTTISGQAVSIIPPSVLATLFHYEREASSEEEATYRQAWLQLMVENAQFRIVQPTGLVSVPEDHFDQFIFMHSSHEWHKVAYVVGHVLGATYPPYIQTGDGALINRIRVLVDRGNLVADGNPKGVQTCRIRLPNG